MILLIDTSTSVCKTVWVTNESYDTQEWDAGRTLADSLLGYLRGQLHSRGLTWRDIQAIAVFQGPGSFTGLRISHTVMNTIADTYGIPIVGVSGDKWGERALERLRNGENDKLILPLYGREANITVRRK